MTSENDNYTDDTPICKPLNPSFGFATRHEVDRIGLCWRCGTTFTEAHEPSGDKAALGSELPPNQTPLELANVIKGTYGDLDPDLPYICDLLIAALDLTQPAEPLDSHQHDTCDCKPMSDELLAALADEPVPVTGDDALRKPHESDCCFYPTESDGMIFPCKFPREFHRIMDVHKEKYEEEGLYHPFREATMTRGDSEPVEAEPAEASGDEEGVTS